MGRVVSLDPQGAGRARGQRGARAPRRRRRGKTALVLGGGGFTGSVYEIGALRALDLLSVNRTVNDFDIFVGTSAGSAVAALAANGITPEEMMRVLAGHAPAPFTDLGLNALLRPNVGELASAVALAPVRIARLLGSMAGNLRGITPLDLALGLAQVLPSGLYTGAGIEGYMRRVLSETGHDDDFRMLSRELYLAATDLDNCERIVLGSDGWDDIPISTAVSASSALPMLYKPVRVRDRELVDGGIVSTTNLDIAVEAGASFIVVVNPLVPYLNDTSKRVLTLGGTRPRRISDMGFPLIGHQVFKLLAYRRLHQMARGWEERYPGVDIILIEPAPDDELMFQTSVMNYSSRVAVARHGFQSVTMHLAEDYDRFKEVTARHGIEISATRVRDVVSHFATEREPTRAWRKILEQTTSAVLRQSSAE